KDVGDSLNAEPIRRKALGQLAEARLMEEQADYESAIALYKQVEGKKELDEAERSAIGKRRRELEKAWQVKGKEHEAAREFIYKKWAQLDLTREIKTNLPEADKAFKACRTAGDRLTALKLKLVNDAIGIKLKERLDSLRPDLEDDK